MDGNNKDSPAAIPDFIKGGSTRDTIMSRALASSPGADTKTPP